MLLKAPESILENRTAIVIRVSEVLVLVLVLTATAEWDKTLLPSSL